MSKLFIFDCGGGHTNVRRWLNFTKPSTCIHTNEYKHNRRNCNKTGRLYPCQYLSWAITLEVFFVVFFCFYLMLLVKYKEMQLRNSQREEGVWGRLPCPLVVCRADVFTNREVPRILWFKSFHRVHLQLLLSPWKSVAQYEISNPLITRAFFFFFNWNIVDLQCWIDLCSTANWFSYTYICI